MAQKPKPEIQPLGDPLLRPYAAILQRRREQAAALQRCLQADYPRLADFAAGHEYLGLHRRDGGWVFREWAPHATAMALVGDFSGWQEQEQYRLTGPAADGIWELRLPSEALRHEQLYQLALHWPGGAGRRLPAWGRRMVQDDRTKIFSAQVWEPPQPYLWQHPDFRRRPEPPLIYEAHVGMAQEEGKVGSYREFEEKILPRIVRAGYNTLQLMAIQEHPYYGSFGYHVTNFFAASSRFGTPEEFKSLVDAAHGAGLAVIMDLVQSHAAKNENEGLGCFDGTRWQYFHDGPRGEHRQWDSRCFNYSKHEVLHFLLSNCRFWLDEYKLDGFRFDGVTSMLYHDHGLNREFLSYDHYFDGNVDDDAIIFLTLANQVIHEVRPDALTVAEDVSGMPGMAAAPAAGGLGFDCRLALGVPDYWIKLLKGYRDEEWDLGRLWFELNNRRPEEHTIGYVESHDQAIVGDQTAIFRLIGQEMYTGMSVFSPPSLVVDRGLALHKMLRLITLATCGGGYLNFMGNEFGHPEWIDFPRAGNDWSYHFARRQWSLRDDPLLKYRFLAEFDATMIALARETQLPASQHPVHLLKHHEADRVLVFERAGLVFVFNFSAAQSYNDYAIEIRPGSYEQVLDTDAAGFGGFQRLKENQVHFTQPNFCGDADRHALMLYLPSRSAQVLRRRD